MNYNSPVDPGKIDQLISICALKQAARVVDFGCGEGAFLLRLAQTVSADCLGFDINKAHIDTARASLDDLNKRVNVSFEQADVRKLELHAVAFDLAVCMGSSHAFADGADAYPAALSQMQRLLKPGGKILIGEGYWKRKPDQEYLDFLGEPTGIYNTFDQNIVQAEVLGLIPLFATESTQDEWDHFEWAFRSRFELEALASPGDEAAQEKLLEIREWNRYYRSHGRTTMGYGHYIFMLPGAELVPYTGMAEK